MAYSIERMPERISIGRETETGVTDVMIDCGAWVSKWPGMALHAIHTPEGGAPYILQTETDGGVLVWHVTDADTATPGTGRMEIVGETDGQRKVSAMVKVSVAARMGGAVGHPPEAAQPWVDRVVEASERITGMQVQAKTLDAGSGATAEWDGEQGLLTIGVPKGEQGPKGEKGEKGEPGKDAVVDATLTKSGQAADAKVTGEAVSKLKDDIGTFTVDEEVFEALTESDYTINKGQFVRDSGAVSDSSLWDHYVIQVVPGEKYRITTTSNGVIVSWLERNESNTSIRYSDKTSSQMETTTEVVICDETTELVVNHRATENTPTIIQKAEYVKHVSDDEAKRIIQRAANVDDVFWKTNVYPARTEFVSYENHASRFVNYNGSELDAVNTYNVAVCTEVSAGDNLLIRGNGNSNIPKIVFYDADGNMISYIAGGSSDIAIFDANVRVPKNTAMLKVNWHTNNSFTAGAVIERVLTYKADGNGWAGIRWACIGDSLTAVNAASNKHYCDYISDRTGIEVINCGAGGMGYWRGNAVNGAFYQTAERIPECDVITIFGSGNDLADNSVFGDYTSTDLNTVAGCVNKTMDVLFDKHPTVPIGVISPTPWGNNPTTEPNNRMEQYVELLRQIAAYRGVPFLDLYHSSGMRPNDAKQNAAFYSSAVIDGYDDYVHPNNVGQKFLYPRFKAFLETLL